MKRFYASAAISVLLILLSRGVWSSGFVAADIFIALALLFVIAYHTQFPFSSSSFEISEKQEKLLYFPVIAFANLMSVFIAPAILAYTLHLTLSHVLYILIIFFLLIQFIDRRRQTDYVKVKLPAKKDDHFALNILFWGSIIVTLVMAVHYGCWLSGDYTWHGTNIRKLRELSTVPFHSYLIKDIPYPMYGHNIWHLFLALVSFLSGKDTAQVWVNANLFLPLLRLSVFYVLAKEAFRSSYWGKVSVIIYLVFNAFLGMGTDGDTPFLEHKWSWDVPYPSEVAREIFLTLFVAYLFKTVNKKALYVKETVALSLCIVLIHFFYMFQLLFLIFALFVFSFIINGDESKYFRLSLRTYALAILPAAVYMFVYKSLLDSPATINPWFFTPEVVGDWNNRVLTIWKVFPFIHPWRGFLRNPFFAVAILSIIPVIYYLIKNKKPSFWKVYLIGITAGLALIFFNPPLLYVLKKFNPGMDRVWRVVEIMPVKLTLAGFFYQISEENGFIKKKNVTMMLFVGVLLLLPVFKKYHSVITYNAALWNKTAEQHIAYKNVLEKVVPPGEQVCLDPQIAWTWTTIFPHYVYMHPFPAGLPPNYDPMPRYNLWKAFFAETITAAQVEDLRRAKVSYLILTSNTYKAKEKELASLSGYFETPVFISPMGVVAIKVKEYDEP